MALEEIWVLFCINWLVFGKKRWFAVSITLYSKIIRALIQYLSKWANTTCKYEFIIITGVWSNWQHKAITTFLFFFISFFFLKRNTNQVGSFINSCIASSYALKSFVGRHHRWWIKVVPVVLVYFWIHVVYSVQIILYIKESVDRVTTDI